MPPHEDVKRIDLTSKPDNGSGNKTPLNVIDGFSAKDRAVFEHYISYHPELRVAICNKCGSAIVRESLANPDSGLCGRSGCRKVMSPDDKQTVFNMLRSLALVSKLKEFQPPSYLSVPLREISIHGHHIMCAEPCMYGEEDHQLRIRNRGNVCGKMFRSHYDLRGHWMRCHPQLSNLSNGRFESNVFWQQLYFRFMNDGDHACRRIRFQVKVIDGTTAKRENTKQVLAIRTMVDSPVIPRESPQMTSQSSTVSNKCLGKISHADPDENASTTDTVDQPSEDEVSGDEPDSDEEHKNNGTAEDASTGSKNEAIARNVERNLDLCTRPLRQDMSPCSSTTTASMTTLAEAQGLVLYRNQISKGKQPALSEPTTIASMDSEAGPAAFQRYLSFVESIPERRQDLAFASDWLQATIDAMDGLTGVLHDHDLPLEREDIRGHQQSITAELGDRQNHPSSEVGANTTTLKRAVKHMDNLARSLAEFEEMPVKRVRRG